MIELRNVTKKYDGKTAVDDISIKVDKGDFCVLIGQSGCGKSTTLRMINRLIEPTDGDILIDEKDIKKQKPEMLRRNIGYVIQNIGLFPHMTVQENISVVPKLLKWEQDRIDEQVESLLDLVELGYDYKAKYPTQLSGGEAQRVGVARALAAEPSILLMDEPFGALDPVTRESLQSGLLRIHRKLKKTVVFVTHDIDEAIRLATKVAIMKDGRILQYDTPENILNAPADNFTAKFVGKDRALKGLARLLVEDVYKRTPAVYADSLIKDVEGLFGSDVYLWVKDDAGSFKGWLSNEQGMDADLPVADYMLTVHNEDFCVTTETSLKDALSKLVMHGVVVLPVTERGVYVGEISLQKILEVGSEQ